MGSSHPGLRQEELIERYCNRQRLFLTPYEGRAPIDWGRGHDREAERLGCRGSDVDP